MRPDKTSIYALFDPQRRYMVPLYQRQYVWTKEEQWLPLWEDVSDKARLVQEGEARAPHFLGAIVTSQRQVFANEIPAWDIIDGQQRLTTLQVLLKAFFDVVTVRGEKKYDYELTRVIRNEGLIKDPVECFKVWPTNSDRAAFAKVMSSGSLAALTADYPGLRGRQKRVIPALVEAYAFFYRTIEQYLDGGAQDGSGPSSISRLDALFQTFRQYLQIVNIELEAGDDPQVIFESLNGRGVPLLPSDLVRNFVFMKASRDGADLDGLYARSWKHYDEYRVAGSKEESPWWKTLERQGRINRPRLDLFLFHYLQFRLEQEVNIGHLFQEFRNWWTNAGSATAESALAEMREYSGAFASWLQPLGDDRISRFARVLKALDTSTIYPLMFLVLVELKAKLPVEEANGIIADLESYLVRRTVCRLTNKQYNRQFVALLRRLRKAGTVDRQVVRDHLLAGRGDSVRWPDDEEFGRAFIHRPAYKTLKRDVTWSVLRALEDALRTSKHEQIQIAGKLSIEHVMPQQWRELWPLEPGSDDEVEARERLLHSFGNLTLVTPEFNTALSNKPFQRKQKEFRRISRLLLSRDFEDAEDWDEVAIVARGRALFDIARRVWPHPLSPESVTALSLDFQPEGGRVADIEESEEIEPAIGVPAALELLDAFAATRVATA